MAKYETEFEHQVVKSFLAGDGGAKLLARRWSVPEEKIRTWVSHYRLHGLGGLQLKRSVYSAQFKLQVLSHQTDDHQVDGDDEVEHPGGNQDLDAGILPLVRGVAHGADGRARGRACAPLCAGTPVSAVALPTPTSLAW